MQQIKATKYYEILIDEFYLDQFNQVRRTKDGYLGRFNKGDLAKFFIGTAGYEYFQVPKIRNTLKKSQLVYSLKFGLIPESMDIDHIDGNKLNNLPDNLRLVTRKVNNRNRKKRSDNSSGITGISWSKNHGHYVIRRTVGNKRLSTSRKSMEDAIIALNYYKTLDKSYTERHGM